VTKLVFTWTERDVDEELEGGVDDQAELGCADDDIVNLKKQNVTKAGNI
jgi:hypothetical protein